MENWKDIEGYEGYYQVSDMGRVKSLARTIRRNNVGDLTVREKIKKTSTDEIGRVSVSLSKDGVHITKRVHQLVAQAFIGAQEDGYHVHHLNGNQSDNRLSNLEIVLGVTHNSNHSLGSLNSFSVLTEGLVVEIYNEVLRNEMSSLDIAKRYNVKPSTVSSICSGQNWSHLGLRRIKRVGAGKGRLGRIVFLD